MRAAMSEDDRYAEGPRPCDRLRHGPARDDEAEPVGAVEPRGDRRQLFDRERRPRIDQAIPEAPEVDRHPADPVRGDPAQVRLDEAAGDGRRIRCSQPMRDEERRDEGPKLLSLDRVRQPAGRIPHRPVSPGTATIRQFSGEKRKVTGEPSSKSRVE
jgi:hypothetical protein